jgi:bifunctional DNA-binding transcriptional regulator/antitoxin component of YhaV-PrlF toxin-antitoxin module
MPQLVKGGKHVFGWSRVGNTGRIVVPREALEEYRLRESEKLILVPGSRTSGGFGLGSPESLSGSPRGEALRACPELGEFRVSAGEAVEYDGKPYCWVELRGGRITVPPTTLEGYGVQVDDSLLVIRGSGLAIGFAVRGPIVEEARRHPELVLFQADSEGDMPRSSRSTRSAKDS